MATLSDAEARRIAARNSPAPRHGSLAWLFIETGAIPQVPGLLLEDLAIVDVDDRVRFVAYLEACGPRPSIDGWERITVAKARD